MFAGGPPSNLDVRVGSKPDVRKRSNQHPIMAESGRSANVHYWWKADTWLVPVTSYVASPRPHYVSPRLFCRGRYRDAGQLWLLTSSPQSRHR